ncbi:hypothetical protein [Methanolobus sp.]|uniref:hypothetical protein n=1 Tax=Methanolobus sp. TaxID=1874737 RepID=UPI0025E4788E|nr:hypothetical protein [Methanolobus sp.]
MNKSELDYWFNPSSRTLEELRKLQSKAIKNHSVGDGYGKIDRIAYAEAHFWI